MKDYNICVTWVETATCKVRANSLEEAKRILRDDPGKYVPEQDANEE